jgi:hypothetical protein
VYCCKPLAAVVAPVKPLPISVITVPTGPDDGENEVTVGATCVGGDGGVGAGGASRAATAATKAGSAASKASTDAADGEAPGGPGGPVIVAGSVTVTVPVMGTVCVVKL